MISNGENVDDIGRESNIDDNEAGDTTVQQISRLASDLEDLNDVLDTKNDKIKRLNERLRSLPRDQINAHTSAFDEYTLLHIAALRGLVWAVRTLLEAGASVSEQDWDGQSPLHLASSEGHTEVARLLLERRADSLATDAYGDTPFFLAASRGCTEVVRLFLKDQSSNVDINDRGRWNMTALHLAAFGGHEETVKFLLEAKAEVDEKDVDGWTPLMAAMKHKHLGVLRTLLDERGIPQASIQDNMEKTPLLVSVDVGSLEGAKILLEHMPDEVKCDRTTYQKLLSYPKPISEDNAPGMQGHVLEYIQECILNALKADQKAFEEALLWATGKYERHKIAKRLLTWGFNEGESSSGSSVIELATLQKNPDVIWWLIATSPRNSEITGNIKSALNKAKEIAQAQGEVKNSKATRQGAKRGVRSKSNEDNYDAAAATDESLPSNWRQIIDILEDPQIAQVYEDNADLDVPQLKWEHYTSVKEFKALIARFYKAKYVSSTIRRMRDLRETIYDEGPTRIMTGAISGLMITMGKGHESKNSNAKSSRLRATYDEDNLRFTYIYVPATNIEWMKDLLLRIMVDEKMKHGAASYHDVSSFLQSTWFEIPDRTSQSRFMRPQFVERMPVTSSSKRQDESTRQKRSEEQKATTADDTRHEKAQDSVIEKTNDRGVNVQETRKQETRNAKESEEDDFIPSSALYMPFLSFATQTENPGVLHSANEAQDGSGERSKRLMTAYEDSIVHISATLDEAYYHFESEDKKAQDDKDRRNRSQVVTKQLEQNAKRREGSQQPSNFRLSKDNRAKCWPLLRVNQLWIWTVANKWVISATSHPLDDVEQSWLDGFTEHLNKQIEAGGAQSQPGSTKDMMKAIVDYCIGSYERRRIYRDDPNQAWQNGLSIRQLFSNYINHIGRNETELFNKIQRLTNASAREETFKQSTIEAKNLFGEIKDIRDELNIIKSVVNYQNIVQRQLFQADQRELGLAASYIVNDITELESLASRIQSSVDSTLSLLQSEIANFQAEESVRQGQESMKQGLESVNQGKESVRQGKEAARQGDILMAFTLSTIVFLPLSFLSSLFALDVDSFQKAPAWAFGVIFGVAFAFTGLAFVIFIDRSVREYIHKKINGDNLPTHR